MAENLPLRQALETSLGEVVVRGENFIEMLGFLLFLLLALRHLPALIRIQNDMFDLGADLAAHAGIIVEKKKRKPRSRPATATA